MGPFENESCLVLGAHALALAAGLVLVWRAVALLFRLIVRRTALRLASSYFLIGIVPIPLLATVLFLASYIAANQYVANRLRREITAVGESALASAAALPRVAVSKDGRVESSGAPWLQTGSKAPWLLWPGPASCRKRDASGSPFRKVPRRFGFWTSRTRPPRIAGGWIESLALPSFPLGLFPEKEFPSREYTFAAGDLVVLFSDGLVEVADAHDEPFGFDRFESVLRDSAAAGAAALRDAILSAVAAHTGGRPSDDDRTMVIMTLD